MICRKKDPSVYRTGFMGNVVGSTVESLEQVEFGFESGCSVEMFTAVYLTIKGYLDLPGWQSYLESGWQSCLESGWQSYLESGWQSYSNTESGW